MKFKLIYANAQALQIMERPSLIGLELFLPDELQLSRMQLAVCTDKERRNGIKKRI